MAPRKFGERVHLPLQHDHEAHGARYRDGGVEALARHAGVVAAHTDGLPPPGGWFLDFRMSRRGSRQRGNARGFPVPDPFS